MSVMTATLFPNPTAIAASDGAEMTGLARENGRATSSNLIVGTRAVGRGDRRGEEAGEKGVIRRRRASGGEWVVVGGMAGIGEGERRCSREVEPSMSRLDRKSVV